MLLTIIATALLFTIALAAFNADFESDFVAEQPEKWYGGCNPCPPCPNFNCQCPSPNQSLIYRSSSEPPYCQRIYFPANNLLGSTSGGSSALIQCPVGFQAACSSTTATFLPACPRRRPAQCPSGFRLVRGTQGRLQCIRFAAPLNAQSAQGICGVGEFPVCLQIRQPIFCQQPQPVVYTGPNGGVLVSGQNGSEVFVSGTEL